MPACPCEPCAETPLFDCTYCCGEARTCQHRHPRTGRCVDDFTCPEPCDSAAGRRASGFVTFPEVTELNYGGEASWVRFPGGPILWGNVDTSNFPPLAEPSDLVEVLLSSAYTTAAEVADAFAAVAGTLGYSLLGTGAVRHFQRSIVGGANPPEDSGPFTFTAVDLGQDPGESRCQLPVVELPFDGYRPFLDQNDDGIDDHTACVDACIEEGNAARVACAAGDEGSYGRCECDEAANVAQTLCVENCRVSMVPRWLDYIEDVVLDERLDCCRGEYATCLGLCEQTYFGAVSASEATYAAQERDALIGFATFRPPCANNLNDNPFGPKAPTDMERAAIRRCILAERAATRATARETRTLCGAACREAERRRRGLCGAREARCHEGCDAAFQRVVDASSRCDADGDEAIETATVALATCRKECCTDAHPHARNEHALAHCLWEAWEKYARDTLACCFGADHCIETCGLGDLFTRAMCMQDCKDTYEGCGGGLNAEYNAARALCFDMHRSDCPLCFDPPGLPGVDVGGCTTSTEYGASCVDRVEGECPDGCSPEDGGFCGEPGFFCTCPDYSCATLESVNCLGFECTRTYVECEPGEMECDIGSPVFPRPNCRLSLEAG